ncbi:hypothetical protein BJX70DRAFT_154614 [Aspergillus crustosus]
MSFKKPPKRDEDALQQEQPKQPPRQPRRTANLYDAVAGRVNAHGFIPVTPSISKYRDTASSGKRAIPPEEVLFRRKDMPLRYEETDRYFAHESLPPDRPLPSSELLESIHAFTADFYDQGLERQGRGNNYSMNGNSLMFMGILLDELAKESLGETGDLVLVEGEPIPSDDESTSRLGRRIGRKRANSGASSIIYASSGEELENVVRRNKRFKKRKLTRWTSTDMDTEAEERR